MRLSVWLKEQVAVVIISIQNWRHERIKVKVSFLLFFLTRVWEICVDSENSTIPQIEEIMNFGIVEFFFEIRVGKLYGTTTTAVKTTTTSYVFCRYALHKKWSFSLKISSVNVTKSAVFFEFGQIYWRNP